jgi:hypothetical protein
MGRRVHGARLLAGAALVAAGLAANPSPAPAGARPAAGDRPAWGGEVSRVPVEPPGIEDGEQDWAATGGRSRCVNVGRVRSAVARGERIIELRLRGGTTLHMRFAENCPFIAFYDGFYYSSELGGRLCARRDAVIARSGGACTIEAITRAPR